MKKNKTEIFIQKAKKIHGDKYNYDKVIYKNANTKVTITCPIHGDYMQLPYNHISGKNDCPICSNRVRRTTQEFISLAKEVHGDMYDYSKVKYINNIKKVKIICPEHGEFLQSPVKHINGNTGCPKCGIKKRASSKTYDKSDFVRISKLKHGNKYDYSKTEYINSKTKVIIICSDHGEFIQAPDKHIQGQGCPVCKTSRGEGRINLFLESNDIKYKYQYKFVDCVNIFSLPFDFFLPDKNICIEYDGIQHFDKESRYYSDRLIENDNIKTKYCKDNNIKLIRIPYTEFKNIETILKKELKKD